MESTFIELIFPNERNMICGCIYKHPSIKISRFNSEYLTPLLTNVQKEEKICMLMGDFNNLLKLGTHWGFKWILTEDFKFWAKSNIILT